VGTYTREGEESFILDSPSPRPLAPCRVYKKGGGGSGRVRGTFSFTAADANRHNTAKKRPRASRVDTTTSTGGLETETKETGYTHGTNVIHSCKSSDQGCRKDGNGQKDVLAVDLDSP